jgi:hypothetical protein
MSLRAALEPEWQRIDVLTGCLVSARRGEQIPEDTKLRLQALQESVLALRQQAIWQDFIPGEPLSVLDADILACSLAPVAKPSLGWTYQELQPGVVAPYPSPALMSEILCMSDQDTASLYSRLAANAPLVREGILELQSADVFHPVRPSQKAKSVLFGAQVFSVPPPPGTVNITAPGGWDDLVLPDYCMQSIREFTYWVQYHEQVVDVWGGRKNGGPVALFTGPSGTGKTFSATVIANELGWPLFRVDLGLLVSKYIGETEKNLNALFDAASNRHLALLFDEAESLFGKRGEIKEARDRYANMEVSHLLSRIERHNGPCILTSNLGQQLDPAFARRFQAVVEFPVPDVIGRSALWEMHLPPRAPREPELDVQVLGEAIQLTGGQIRNAALHAAYLAAADSSAIGMQHIARAVWVEMSKDGREVMMSNLGVLANYLATAGSDVAY